MAKNGWKRHISDGAVISQVGGVLAYSHISSFTHLQMGNKRIIYGVCVQSHAAPTLYSSVWELQLGFPLFNFVCGLVYGSPQASMESLKRRIVGESYGINLFELMLRLCNWVLV